MVYPKLNVPERWEQRTESFLGYDHEDRIPEGAFYETRNLTTDRYPLLATRRKRGILRKNVDGRGLLGKARIAWIDGRQLWYGTEDVTRRLTDKGISLSDGQKQMVSMGAYIVILPDGIWYNTQDPEDCGLIENRTRSSGVRVSICTREGDSCSYTIGNAAPAEPVDGDRWLCTAASPHSMKLWSGERKEWIDVPSVYVKLEARGIGAGFRQEDGVTIRGLEGPEGASELLARQLAQLNGSHILHRAGEDYVVITGLVDRTAEGLSCTIERKMPKLDFVVEAQNRLWGCRYGIGEDGKTLNEICCCALGDFRNWQRFAGISTDSYAASCGTDGPWTGAVNHLGHPLFFKENRLHKVYISSTGAHQILDIECRGVQSGCHRSLAAVGGKLYYRSRDGICVYDGSIPELTDHALGRERYYDAVGGSYGDKYYVSMRDAGGEWGLFVLDTGTGMWMHEDWTRARYMARCGDELYMLTEGGELMAVNGTAGEEEGELHWMAQTGIIGCSETGHKRVSRFNIRMRLPEGSRLQVLAEYDSEGLWHPVGRIMGSGLRTFLLPVRPRRCDHFRLRLEGEGEAAIFSFSKVYEPGSDGG